jgi:hypothetical protein
VIREKILKKVMAKKIALIPYRLFFSNPSLSVSGAFVLKQKNLSLDDPVQN